MSRVVPAWPPADIAITRPAAASPPQKARPPAGSAGSETPNAATATIARWAPALTARVSGDASGLRAIDCNAAPANPSATPMANPASSRGNREASRTRAASSSAPDRQPQQVEGADRRGALGQVHRAHHEQQQDRGDEGSGDAGHGQASARSRPGGRLRTWGCAQHAHTAYVLTSSSMYCLPESGPPKVHMPLGILRTLPFWTKGSDFQIALPARPSANTSSPSEAL